MTTYLEKRWGGGGQNPTERDLLEALDEMGKLDPEHPDCWLVDANQWSIAFNEDGRIVLENSEGEEGPWHMKNSTKDIVLTLWRHLQRGQMTEIRAFQWIEGYR